MAPAKAVQMRAYADSREAGLRATEERAKNYCWGELNKQMYALIFVATALLRWTLLLGAVAAGGLLDAPWRFIASGLLLLLFVWSWLPGPRRYVRLGAPLCVDSAAPRTEAELQDHVRVDRRSPWWWEARGPFSCSVGASPRGLCCTRTGSAETPARPWATAGGGPARGSPRCRPRGRSGERRCATFRRTRDHDRRVVCGWQPLGATYGDITGVATAFRVMDAATGDVRVVRAQCLKVAMAEPRFVIVAIRLVEAEDVLLRAEARRIRGYADAEWWLATPSMLRVIFRGPRRQHEVIWRKLDADDARNPPCRVACAVASAAG